MEHDTATWDDLAAARDDGELSERNPDIAILFQQIRNLREGERSIRSLRRSLALDNMPVLDVTEAGDDEPLTPEAELDQLLDRFLQVKREKDEVERRFRELLAGFVNLQETVRKQAEEIEALRAAAVNA